MARFEATSCDAGCGTVSDKCHVSPLNRPGGWCQLEITHHTRGWTTYDLCSLECLEVIAMRLNGFVADEAPAKKALTKPRSRRPSTGLAEGREGKPK